MKDRSPRFAISDHCDGERFFNPGGIAPRGLKDLLRWQFGGGKMPWPRAFPSPFQDVPPPRVPSDAMRICLIGHASFLIQSGGLNILLDPVYSDRASPFAVIGPQRVNPPGIAFDALPRIDIVLVSHNHFDHLDDETLARLWRRDRPRFIAPLGNEAAIRARAPAIAVETLDWGAILDVAPQARLYVEPAQHWSRRRLFDRNRALWASFVIQTPWGKLFCAGDTGFGDGALFRALAARHPDLDLGLLPIGAYEPRWFMRGQHVNPGESVEIFQLLGLRAAIGYHWGTFRLTNEGITQPREDLAIALDRAGLDAARFRAFLPGEVWQEG